jgi:hypothetical protein
VGANLGPADDARLFHSGTLREAMGKSGNPLHYNGFRHPGVRKVPCEVSLPDPCRL